MPDERTLAIILPTYCSHSIAISADQWPDDLRLSDIEPRFACKASGKRGADIRPILRGQEITGLLMLWSRMLNAVDQRPKPLLEPVLGTDCILPA